MIKQIMEVTNLQEELKKQINAKNAKTKHINSKSKKVIVGSRNFYKIQKNSTIGSSRPITPNSSKNNTNFNINNPDLVIFEDRAETKLLSHELNDKTVSDVKLPSQPITSRRTDKVGRRMQFNSIKSSVLLSEKESAVTPEPNIK